MEKITAIRGFKDILPEDARRFWEVESIARQIFNSFGFQEIRTPIMEKTELFRRSIGETTDMPWICCSIQMHLKNMVHLLIFQPCWPVRKEHWLLQPR